MLQKEGSMSRIGYARVSSLDQDHAAQEARLRLAGCEIIRKEKASGKTRAAVMSWRRSSNSFDPATSLWW
jgi:DNA invertase Pin-like site-specific DNA recombinase